MHSPSLPDAKTAPSAGARVAEEKPRYRSQDLLRGRNEVIIDHGGREYRLKLTRNDKLILNI